MGNLNEYEIDITSYKKYDKYKRENKENKDENKYKKVEINKNNYFKEMKNLEEEIELDEEQNDYSPPIFNPKNKKIEKNINISDEKINKFQKTPPPNSQNFAKNYYQPSQNNKYTKKKIYQIIKIFH